MECKFKEKLVSVVMAAYNTAEYIEETIESILNQTYRHFEFIIINDGSTDSTLNIIMEYARKDDRIIVISQKNMGTPYALNAGIRIARGNYIARMDSDDICVPERFEKQVVYLNEHPNIFMVGSNYYTIYSDSLSEECIKKYRGAEKRGKESIDMEHILLSISETQKFMHSSAMIRREFFEITGLYHDLISEDIELIFRGAAKGLGIAKIEEELYGYRAREDSRSYSEPRDEATAGIINAKMNWLFENLDNSFLSVKYYIWGADISGQVAKEILNVRIADGECLGFIDPVKAGGTFCNMRIMSPDVLKDELFDYVFICTQAGAKMARGFMKDLGKKEVYHYFKIS